MTNSYQEQWENFLTPELLRTNLISASIYITAFEIMKDSIIKRVQDFYMFTNFGLEEKDVIALPQYQNDVIKKHTSLIYASLDWLKEENAIDENDIIVFNDVKITRNILAHEFPRLLIEGLPAEFQERFHDLVALLNKVEKWWVTNFEIPTNPDFDGKKIDEERVIPGPILHLQILLDVALGSEESAKQYLDKIKKQKNKSK
jgi:hypothetical protein